MSNRVWQLSLLAGLMLVQCGAAFDPGYRVTSLRVLAVKADKPIAHPGDTVNMTSLWYTKADDTRPQQWLWATCKNPIQSSVYGCIATIAAEAQSTGQLPAFTYKTNDFTSASTGFDSYSFVVPSDTVSSQPTASQSSAMVGVLLIVCPGTLSFVSPTSNGSQYNPFQCTEAGTGKVLDMADYVVGFKRVFARTEDTKSNPTITGLKWDNSDWDSATVPTVESGCGATENTWSKCDSGKQHRISVDTMTPATGADQFGQPISESIVVEYYMTDGLFDHPTRLATSADYTFTNWIGRTVSAPTTQTFWVVAHDSRGGTDWVQRTVSQSK